MEKKGEGELTKAFLTFRETIRRIRPRNPRKTNNIYPLTRQKYSFQCFRTEMRGDVEGGGEIGMSVRLIRKRIEQRHVQLSSHKTL